MSLFKNDNFTKSMKTFTFILLLTVASFGFGFAYKTIIVNQNKNASNMKKVTGIGGIFFKCKDPKKMTEWYQKHLGLETNPYGATFEWYEGADSTKKAQTQWTPFAETTKYFEPSTKDFDHFRQYRNLRLWKICPYSGRRRKQNSTLGTYRRIDVKFK